jgi:hypothetical protein
MSDGAGERSLASKTTTRPAVCPMIIAAFERQMTDDILLISRMQNSFN